MTDQDFKPRFFRIYSHRTKTRILHIEDALAIDRIHLDVYEYARGQGTKNHAEFFITSAEARLIFSDLIVCSLPVDSKGVYQQLMTGTPRDGKLQSRTLKIEVISSSDARKPLAFEVMNCEGERLGQGAVKPKSGATQTRVRVLLDWRTARKIGLHILAHMNAWAAATYHNRIAAETWQPDDPPAADADPEPNEAAKPTKYQPTKQDIERNGQAQLKEAKKEARKAGLNQRLLAQIEMAAPTDTLGQVAAIRMEIMRYQDNPTGAIPDKKFNRAGLVLALQEKIYHATTINVSIPSIDPLWEWKWTWQKMVEFGQSLNPLITQATSQA